MAGDYVVVELQGRLGNQLFQFASGYGIARRRNAWLRFSSRRVAGDDLRLPELGGAAYCEATTGELVRVGAYPDAAPGARALRGAVLRGARLERRLRRRTPPSVVVWEDTGRYRPEVLTVDLPVRLVGHLQSERYFVDVADEVRAAIHLPAPPVIGSASRPTVAVSFRRGDYNTLGWALPLDYYDRAMALVAERVGPATVVCFGDDPAFVALIGERLAAYGEVVDAVALAPDAVAQLALMRACDHHVIANSSFAWWGAWLGDGGEPSARLVIAPEEFAGGGDRLPERWTTLPSGTARF